MLPTYKYMYICIYVKGSIWCPKTQPAKVIHRFDVSISFCLPKHSKAWRHIKQNTGRDTKVKVYSLTLPNSRLVSLIQNQLHRCCAIYIGSKLWCWAIHMHLALFCFLIFQFITNNAFLTILTRVERIFTTKNKNEWTTSFVKLHKHAHAHTHTHTNLQKNGSKTNTHTDTQRNKNTKTSTTIWWFPKIGVGPQNGWWK